MFQFLIEEHEKAPSQLTHLYFEELQAHELYKAEQLELLDSFLLLMGFEHYQHSKHIACQLCMKERIQWLQQQVMDDEL